MSVDLPAPFSPHSACTSPRRTWRSTSLLATTPGKRFVMPHSSTTYSFSAMAPVFPLDARGARRPVWRAEPPSSLPRYEVGVVLTLMLPPTMAAL